MVKHLALIALTAGTVAAADVAVLGSLQLTRSAVGVASGTDPQRQTAKPSIGSVVEFRQPWRGIDLQGSYGAVRSDAQFYPLLSPGSLKFDLVRHELEFEAVKRAGITFAGVGVGGFITDGGYAPGGRVGLDSQFELVMSGGTDIKLSRHLAFRSEIVTHWFRAPNFSDPEYRAGRTVIIEPRVGLVWRSAR